MHRALARMLQAMVRNDLRLHYSGLVVPTQYREEVFYLAPRTGEIFSENSARCLDKLCNTDELRDYVRSRNSPAPLNLDLAQSVTMLEARLWAALRHQGNGISFADVTLVSLLIHEHPFCFMVPPAPLTQLLPTTLLTRLLDIAEEAAAA